MLGLRRGADAPEAIVWLEPLNYLWDESEQIGPVHAGNKYRVFELRLSLFWS